MSGFTTKLNAKCAKLIYHTAAATLAIEEDIPFSTIKKPLLRRLFASLNHELDKIDKLQCHQVKDAVTEMGGYAVEATKREIRPSHCLDN
jgi:hypothetical protein